MIFDSFCVLLIAAAVVACLMCGFRKTAFKVCTGILFMLLAVDVGDRLGSILISDIIRLVELVTGLRTVKRISASFSSAAGTLILFVAFTVLIRLMLKVIDGRKGNGCGCYIERLISGAWRAAPTYLISKCVTVLRNVCVEVFKLKLTYESLYVSECENGRFARILI